MPGLGARIVELLELRHPMPTSIVFTDGMERRATFEGFVRDIGDEWEKVHFSVDGVSYLTCTSEIAALIDPASGVTLYQRTKLLNGGE